MPDAMQKRTEENRRLRTEPLSEKESSPNASRAGGQNGLLEFGVKWRSKAHEFIASGFTESGARSMVGKARGPKWSPEAVEVMVRDVSEWRPAGEAS